MLLNFFLGTFACIYISTIEYASFNPFPFRLLNSHFLASNIASVMLFARKAIAFCALSVFFLFFYVFIVILERDYPSIPNSVSNFFFSERYLTWHIPIVIVIFLYFRDLIMNFLIRGLMRSRAVGIQIQN